MKTIKTILTMGLGAVLAASCLSNDDPYNAGFVLVKPASGVSYLFANNTADSLVLFSYGDWAISNYSGYSNSWVTLPLKNGKGQNIYGMRVEMTQNTTGESRTALFSLDDTSHPGDANSAFGFLQFATRGDGSLGNAADVKTITGSDGSKIGINYDEQHRPTSLTMVKNETSLYDLTIRYNDRDSIMYVTENGIEMESYFDNDYQPVILHSSTDTVTYSTLYYSYIPISANKAFNYEHRRKDASRNICVRYLFPGNGVSLSPDSLHNADTLSYFKETQLVRKLGFEYANQDNRRQSVDVNQLLLGIEECDPYLLLSFYRYCRNTSIVKRARDEKGEIAVQADLNADKSVNRLTVVNDGETIVYTFEY